jgi:hypothetical protein
MDALGRLVRVASCTPTVEDLREAFANDVDLVISSCALSASSVIEALLRSGSSCCSEVLEKLFRIRAKYLR